MEKDAFRVGKYTPLLPGRKNKLGKKILRGSFYFLTLSLSVIAALSSISVALRVSNIPVKYTTYERIGNIECPDIPGTSLIYRGITISYSYNSTQNTPTSYSGFRCMPRDKEYIDYYTDDFPYEEDQVNNGNITKYITSTGSNHRDALCAVCMVEGRGSIVVQPGTDKCLDSWTTEYNGYLMTGYTCVDTEMQGSIATGYPARVAFLRHEVISTKVSPYYQDQNVLSCVVCSK